MGGGNAVTRQLSLSVNEAPIKLDYFVRAFVDHTFSGMVQSLEGTGPFETASLSIDGDEVVLTLNDSLVPTNMFASKIIRSTAIGMVSPLKGVGSTVTNLKLEVGH